MSSGFHYLGRNAGKNGGYSNLVLQQASLVVALGEPKPVPPADPHWTKEDLHDLTEVHSPLSMKQMGYTGDQCSNCNSMRMKVSGHCMVCEDCGTTTGCS